MNYTTDIVPILTNVIDEYVDDVDGVFTLIHELGAYCPPPPICWLRRIEADLSERPSY